MTTPSLPRVFRAGQSDYDQPLAPDPAPQMFVSLAQVKALIAAFGIAAWAPNTAYAAQQLAVAPTGQVVAANTGFTSGASYNAANWTVVNDIGAGGSGSVDLTPYLQKTDAAGTYLTKTQIVPTPFKYGGVGDGTADDTTALQNLLNSGAKSIDLAGKTWAVSAPLIYPVGGPKIMGNGGTIKATASMSAVIKTPDGLTSASNVTFGAMQDLIIDCNAQATTGVLLQTYGHFELTDVTVWTPLGDWIVLGVAGAPFPGPGAYNAYLTDVNCDSLLPVVPGSVGVRIIGTDNRLLRVTVIGADISFSAQAGGCKFWACHGYGHFGKKPSVIFKDTSLGNEYVSCHADSSTQYGWDLSGYNTRIIGGHVFANTDTDDNTMIGINVRPGSGYHIIDKTYFSGNDASHRVAQDITGAAADLATCTIGDFTYGNIVTRYQPTEKTTGSQTTAARIMHHLRSAVGQHRDLLFETGVSPRWRLRAEGTAESGSNAGSDLVLSAIDDSGAFLRDTLRFSRRFGTITPGGPIAQLVVSATGKTSSYSMTANDVLIFASNGAPIQLPTAVAVSGVGGLGSIKTIKNTGTSDVVVTSAGGNIEGGAQVTIPPSDSLDFASDGTNWWVI